MVPEIVKFTIKNFIILLAVAIAILAFSVVGTYIVSFSNYYLGNPFYGIIIIFLMFIMIISFKMAQMDVKTEERKRERTFEDLKKD